jgi:ABC-type multidrug transport system permease subunit
MQQIFGLIYREALVFRRKFWRHFFQFSISPLLYLVAFGWAGSSRMEVNGVPYITFILPGLVSMSAMVNSFSISTEINIARFYWHTFDEIRSAPVSDFSYVIGEVISGILRGMLAAALVIVLGMIFGVHPVSKGWLIAGIALNALIFSSIAVSTAMLAKSHADQGMLGTFVITPMAFLCGTFFPVDRYPYWVGALVNMLPLTQANHLIRAASMGQQIPMLACVYLLVFGALSVTAALMVVGRAKN